MDEERVKSLDSSCNASFADLDESSVSENLTEADVKITADLKSNTDLKPKLKKRSKEKKSKDKRKEKSKEKKNKKEKKEKSNEKDEELLEEEKDQIEKDKQQDIDQLRQSRNDPSTPSCLRCRQDGHLLRDCPLEKKSKSICYNCGSEEHRLSHCHLPRGKSLPFASCFICNQTGHLSSQCADNPRGIYPNGGGCRFCGSNKHLARDCRPTTDKEHQIRIDLNQSQRMTSADDDHVFSTLKSIQDERSTKKHHRESGYQMRLAKKSKVVRFN